jgi:YD repeat-containing protein
MVKKEIARNVSEYYDEGRLKYKETVVNGLTTWQEFNNNGDVVREKNSDGVVRESEYSGRNLTYFKEEHSNGFSYELWLEYDANGNVTHRRDTQGDEWWRTYDADGRETYYKNGAVERWRTYDAKGHEIERRDKAGVVFEKQYDADGKEVYYKDATGEWARAAEETVVDPDPFKAEAEVKR